MKNICFNLFIVIKYLFYYVKLKYDYYLYISRTQPNYIKDYEKAIKSQLLEFLPTVRFQVPCIDNKISLSLLLNN